MKQLIFISMCVLFLQGCNKQKPKTELDEVRGKWELEKTLEYGLWKIIEEHSTTKKLKIEINKKDEIIFMNQHNIQFKLKIINIEVKENNADKKIISIKAKDSKFQKFNLSFNYSYVDDKLTTMYYDPSKPLIFNDASILEIYNCNEGIGKYKRLL